MFLQVIAMVALLASLAEGSFFVISDLHYDILYKDDYNQTYYCHNHTGAKPNPPTSNIQPVLRAGCDSSLAFINHSLSTLYSINPDPDFILILGDFIGHFTSNYISESGILNQTLNQELIRQSHKSIANLLTHYFPSTQIIPSIGNNDAYKNYKVPQGKDHEDYFNFLYELWNPLVKDLPLVFKQNGFYNISTRNGFNVIVLNSNLFSVYEDLLEQAYEQFVWFEEQLEISQNVIIALHIPPTMGLYNGGIESWHQAYVEKFVEIVNDYEEVIEVIMSAHYHNGIFSLIGNVPVVINPAISVVYRQNPQFRLYDWERMDYHEFSLDPVEFTGIWFSKSFGEEFGFNENYQILLSKLESGSISVETFLKWVSGYWIYPNPDFLSMCFPIFGKSCQTESSSELLKIIICNIKFQIPYQFNLCKSGALSKIQEKFKLD